MRISPYSGYPSAPSGLSRQKQAGNATPKFGWGWDGHNTIEAASIHWLPDSSYKGFLQRHLPEINRVSVRQDTEHEGPQHYLNLEDMSQPPISKQEAHDFSRVRQQFSPQNQATQQQQFRQSPLSAERLARFTNVFQTTTQLYDRLVGLLKQAAIVPWLPPASKVQLGGQITETVGALSHYAADLNQPLHTTRHSTWQTALAKPNEQGSHHFMEVTLFTKSENRNLGDNLAKLHYQPTYLPPLGLKQRLLQQIQNAYLQVFNLTQGDAQARNSPSTYFASLKQAWQPIATQQTVASACTVSDILHSAYEEAGRPDLSQL